VNVSASWRECGSPDEGGKKILRKAQAEEKHGVGKKREGRAPEGSTETNRNKRNARIPA